MKVIAAAAAIAVVTLLTGACGALRFGGPAFDLGGSWDGSVTVQGQRMPGVLTIEQEGRTLHAAFVAPEFDVSAEGTGEVDDEGEFWIELEYDFQCPGTAMLEGTVSDDRATLTGSLDAVDCTGGVTGTFRFTR